MADLFIDATIFLIHPSSEGKYSTLLEKMIREVKIANFKCPKVKLLNVTKSEELLLGRNKQSGQLLDRLID
jgi:phage FluMu protein Com